MFARGKDARVQAEFAEQVAVAKAVADDADGADDACRVGVDFVGGGGDVVRTRCATSAMTAYTGRSLRSLFRRLTAR